VSNTGGLGDKDTFIDLLEMISGFTTPRSSRSFFLADKFKVNSPVSFLDKENDSNADLMFIDEFDVYSFFKL
jgi:hypothetical protein